MKTNAGRNLRTFKPCLEDAFSNVIVRWEELFKMWLADNELFSPDRKGVKLIQCQTQNKGISQSEAERAPQNWITLVKLPFDLWLIGICIFSVSWAGFERNESERRMCVISAQFPVKHLQYLPPSHRLDSLSLRFVSYRVTENASAWDLLPLLTSLKSTNTQHSSARTSPSSPTRRAWGLVQWQKLTKVAFPFTRECIVKWISGVIFADLWLVSVKRLKWLKDAKSDLGELHLAALSRKISGVTLLLLHVKLGKMFILFPLFGHFWRT